MSTFTVQVVDYIVNSGYIYIYVYMREREIWKIWKRLISAFRPSQERGKSDGEKTEATLEMHFVSLCPSTLSLLSLMDFPHCPMAFWSLFNDPNRQAMWEI